ncbi:hypothetical protein N0V95_004433 [Ascochyta clinopodiicola]|nr:hypothetical protein N0V95_004433 [Ascochyta clinopodiicola]
MLVSKSRPITIDPKDIISLNNPCMDKGLKDLRANSKDLALCFAATIAQIPGLDGHRRFNEASTISGYNLSELSDSTPFSLMKIDEVLTGFGYGSTDTSIKLSLAVIISYCVIVVFYVTYIIATGHTSIAWDSAMELVMLALQSHAPDHLGHISVGLDSMDTFRQNVGIRVRVDTEKNVDKLELVFQQDAGVDDGGLGMVEPNKAY